MALLDPDVLEELSRIGTVVKVRGRDGYFQWARCLVCGARGLRPHLEEEPDELIVITTCPECAEKGDDDERR